MVAGYPNQRRVSVGIDNAHCHAHARAVLWAVRCERRARQYFIQVRGDRARLDDAESVIVKHRNLTERVTGKMLGLPRLAFQHMYRYLLILGLLFSKKHPHGADIGAAVEAIENDSGHFVSFLSQPSKAGQARNPTNRRFPARKPGLEHAAAHSV